jgi:restriction endonuclease S subunit
MKTKLEKIASIQMGYSFRFRIESNESGSIPVIQMKDLREDKVDCSQLVKTEIPDFKEHHAIKDGDIIFRSRGPSSTSAIFKEKVSPAVVAAPLLRIRVTHKGVLPEYVHWFINQEPAQNFFSSQAKGTAQKMIGIETLKDLEIIIPPLETQKFIVELAELADKEQRLIKELAGKRKIYLDKILLKLSEGEDNGNQPTEK